jgi:uncharacterized coiled-coil protein SlyX
MGAAERLEERLIDLELRFMKLERFAQELSDTVASQRRAIDGLTLEVRRLRERATDEEPEPGDEVPPHY